LKIAAQCRAEFGPGLQCTARAACHVRSADQPARPWPGGPVQSRRQPAAFESSQCTGRRGKRRGWGSARCRVGTGEGAERGPGFSDMGQHGMDTAASGCSDSGGQHTPSGRNCDRGGRWAAMTRARTADWRGVMTWVPGGSGWMQKGARACGAARRGALTDG
jgi:hypothetical protein